MSRSDDFGQILYKYQGYPQSPEFQVLQWLNATEKATFSFDKVLFHACP